MIRLRRAVGADRAAIWEVRTQAIASCITHYPQQDIDVWASAPPPENLERTIESNEFLVVEDDSEIVGTGFLDRDQETLEAVFVRPDYQGQGVGTMILQALEAAAINAGIKRLAVAATLNSVPFYTARGFSSRGASSYQHANGFSLPCVSMNKVVG
jgi:N-acetylglutamate synthase-like GNAT family acetyltransferase